MKYILLVHHNEHVLAELSETELQRMREESVQLANQIYDIETLKQAYEGQ